MMSVKMEYKQLLNSYDKNGYIYEYWLLKDNNTELDFQHRIKWKRRYGFLLKGYDLHHINRKKTDNRLGKNIYVFMLFGYVVFKSGNFLYLPKHLHSFLFHNINSK